LNTLGGNIVIIFNFFTTINKVQTFHLWVNYLVFSLCCYSAAVGKKKSKDEGKLFIFPVGKGLVIRGVS